MDALLVLSRALLAVVFVAAGVGKLADREGTLRALTDFGAPPRTTGILATVLPIAEIAVAAALLPEASAKWGALAALALLLVFNAAVLRSLLHGQMHDCHCLGALHSTPAGWRTIARNVLLAGPAVLVALSPTPGPGPEVELALAMGLVAGLGAYFAPWWLGLLGRLFRAQPAQDRSSAPPTRSESTSTRTRRALLAGSDAPPFSLLAGDGALVTLDDLLAPGRPVTLIFVDPSCGPCQELLPSIARWQEELRGRLTVALASGASRETYRPWAREPVPRLMLHDPGGELRDAYGVQGTPSAVLIGRGKKIERDLAYGRDGIETLVADAAGAVGAPVLGQRQPRLHAGSPLSRRQVLAAIGSTLAVPWLAHASQPPDCDPGKYLCFRPPPDMPGGTTCCNYWEYCCQAWDSHLQQGHCCPFGCRPADEYWNPGSAKRGGCLPGPTCGPDVTNQVERAVAATKRAFAGWTASQRRQACHALVSFPSGLSAWDIWELGPGGRKFIEDYARPPYRCATPGTSPSCKHSVLVRSVSSDPGSLGCYFAGSVNYVIFGVMWRLCRDVPGFGLGHDDMIHWIALYKALTSGFAKVPKNTGPAAEWASAGFFGWPEVGLVSPPKPDRANCGYCGLPYSGPKFKVRWRPHGLIFSD
jgi:uncharacterized membrane protein YphA (DoxX/SURF4 family)